MDDLPAPLAVWDAGDPLNCQPDVPRWLESTEWAMAHIPRANDTWRVEFYLIDAPFAVVHRFAVNDAERKYFSGGKVAREEPVIVPLAELPPARLLGGEPLG